MKKMAKGKGQERREKQKGDGKGGGQERERTKREEKRKKICIYLPGKKKKILKTINLHSQIIPTSETN